MDEIILSAMNNAADRLIEYGLNKEETIAEMRDWIDSWELDDDD